MEHHREAKVASSGTPAGPGRYRVASRDRALGERRARATSTARTGRCVGRRCIPAPRDVNCLARSHAFALRNAPARNDCDRAGLAWSAMGKGARACCSRPPPRSFPVFALLSLCSERLPRSGLGKEPSDEQEAGNDQRRLEHVLSSSRGPAASTSRRSTARAALAQGEPVAHTNLRAALCTFRRQRGWRLARSLNRGRPHRLPVPGRPDTRRADTNECLLRKPALRPPRTSPS